MAGMVVALALPRGTWPAGCCLPWPSQEVLLKQCTSLTTWECCSAYLSAGSMEVGGRVVALLTNAVGAAAGHQL